MSSDYVMRHRHQFTFIQCLHFIYFRFRFNTQCTCSCTSIRCRSSCLTLSISSCSSTRFFNASVWAPISASRSIKFWFSSPNDVAAALISSFSLWSAFIWEIWNCRCSSILWLRLAFWLCNDSQSAWYSFCFSSSLPLESSTDSNCCCSCSEVALLSAICFSYCSSASFWALRTASYLAVDSWN